MRLHPSRQPAREQLKYGLCILRPEFTLPLQLQASLAPHPTMPCPSDTGIDVTMVYDRTNGLDLSYRILCPTSLIRLPAPCQPGPADNLWQHTCCEMFIAADKAEAYQEFNFSPSGQWAAYRFSRYRQREADFNNVAPHIALRPQADGIYLDVSLPTAALPCGETFDIALTAVLEAMDGSKSYWALTHCAPQPDFHLRQSFMLTLHTDQP